MIRAVLVFNNQGKARLVKFFEHYVSPTSLARLYSRRNYLAVATWSLLQFCCGGRSLSAVLCGFQTEDEQQGIIKEVYHMVSRRDDGVCNFLEGST